MRKIKGMEIIDKKILEIWIFFVRLFFFLVIWEDVIVFVIGNVRKCKLDYLFNFVIFVMLFLVVMLYVRNNENVLFIERKFFFL